MKTILNADDIRLLLPHRWPFLLLDRIVELKPGVSGVGIKNVTVSEPFFEGHFPKESIMPGVLIVEALAQMTALVHITGALYEMQQGDGNSEPVVSRESIQKLLAGEGEDISSKVGYLASIRDFKFMKPVVPGDQLLLKVQVGRSLGALYQVKVSAMVDKQAVAEGSLNVSHRVDQA
ncbi:3-hydroxyacyl-ACP dehydratase FabZ [Paenibacillus sp. SC116]|uniref:3-hydroxyacyl-ACP dehydratase FabZ n=1 Tax=Paenibacillus sp. SC116 TaxID=2968986 RepID=UPI00215B086C|nr:3-hydroxyacyl-ACP dehydratase FabZ [Paenibacillus sp. SC116]MCR8844724.1 3-hydroxyacyl-ACP dehydratase FabZ [Paenibacillus sp. SC116]